MQVEILYRPSYSVARVSLQRGETIQVESGSMLGMSPDMAMETQAKGTVHPIREFQNTDNFILDLIRSHIQVRIILMKCSHAEKAVEHPAQFVSMNQPDLCCPQR